MFGEIIGVLPNCKVLCRILLDRLISYISYNALPGLQTVSALVGESFTLNLVFQHLPNIFMNQISTFMESI